MRRAHSATVFAQRGWLAPASALVLALVTSSSVAQGPPYEKTFPQSKTTVEKVLKDLQASTAGHLPVLDGFAVPGDRPLDRYQRGYFQCTVQVTATPSGGSTVHVSAKITAWYADPVAAKSGYQALASNGRVESDLLDRLQEALAGKVSSPAQNPPPPPAPTPSANKPDAPVPALSAPAPGASVPIDAVTTSKALVPSASPFKLTTPASDDQLATLATQRAIADRHMEELTKEAKSLEEILRNQAHPNNLVAVRKSGTPVLASPSEGAKVLFLATAGDEFEILDTNASWVHVRISGLSRGWIRRSSLEMPQASAAETPAASPAPAANSNPFQVESEQVASFPGTWEPLQGKTVKIISVQTSHENATSSGSQAKREFAKSVFAKEYGELTQVPTSAAGLVVIFDSADGGMVATTLPVLQQWKAGTLSDEAFWRRCFFDPPDAFGSAAGQ